MHFCMILAMDRMGGIGYQQSLPFHQPNDLKRFRQLTEGHILVMGRKTWESLPKKPLPNRIHIILSRHPFEHSSDVYSIQSIDQLFELRQTIHTDKKWFIIGGKSVYDAFFHHFQTKLQTIYWTILKEKYLCDTYLTYSVMDLNPVEWNITSQYTQEETFYTCTHL